MAEKKNILTYEGLKKLEDELQDLKVNQRREIAQKIKEAREQGDLSENAEYDAAKDEQRDIEARIEQIEKILKNAEVVLDEEIDLDKISIGCLVRVLDVEYDEEEEYKLPVLMLNTGMMEGNWDIAVATMWTTLDFVMSYCNIKRKFYLVQNYESDFYKPGENFRVKANATYAVDGSINYITISKWCKHWLSLQFGQKVRYAPNGICFKQFYEANNERNFCGKIKILIEGDSASYYKNVDESFKIVECLRKDHFEIWYMSYNAEPKDWYHVDKFFHKIPYSEVAKVYQQCDVLIKTSILESFSYPPLEMMAAGGLVLVVPNNGNVEYLKDGENCLLYEQGNIHEAVQKLELMCSDKELRHRLYIGGLNTAYNRDWKKLEEKVIGLYK